MGKITDSINKQIHEAMKAHEEIKLSTLRLLTSALSYEKIAAQRELTDEEEIAVVRREAKKRNDAIEVYEKVGSPERAEAERKELSVLKAYLPQEMSEEELEKIVAEVVADLKPTGMADMGKVIGVVVGKTAGRADGKKVSELVKKAILGTS